MATVNIGSLKFNWKGTYNGSTAYAIDDVTEYNGSSYICILASTGNLPTNTTYFQPMATKVAAQFYAYLFLPMKKSPSKVAKN